MSRVLNYAIKQGDHRVASWPMESTPQLSSGTSSSSAETDSAVSRFTPETRSESGTWSLSDSEITESPPVEVDDDEEDLWDLVDSLYDRTKLRVQQDIGRGISAVSFDKNLIAELDGPTFGVYHDDTDHSTNRVELQFPKPEKGHTEELYIPHFPTLTGAVVGIPGVPVNFPRPPPRTSEPISQGINLERERFMQSHFTRDRFQELLDSHVGLARFKEWINSEGYNGSKALLDYYHDALAQIAYTSVLNRLYRGNGTSPLRSAAHTMERAQTELGDKLYAAEFKRFITGKISAHAKFCLEHFSSWRDRGDIGDIFCLVNPHLPDQPLVMVSDGFCRLTEYPRETLIGRNCRFLQGPATDLDSVDLLRQAIKEGREHCSMLMNYTRTGKAFWNLFNMIPLRGPSGTIDYFLGAQVDCSRALTSPSTFQALTGIHDGDRSVPAQRADNRFAFSTDLLDKADSHFQRSTVFRKFSNEPIGTKTTPQTFQSPRFVRADGNRHYGSLARASSQTPNGPARDPMEPIPIPQEVPNPVRAHMSAFSSAFSKLIVFDAGNGLVRYITAPLLAILGYPIRTLKDRVASSIIGSSILDLIIGETPSQTKSNRDIVRQVIETSATHSCFTGLAACPKGLARISESTSPAGEDGDQKDGHMRHIVHFAPMKDGENKAVYYVAVVG